MNIVISPDSYKGSNTAVRVAEAMERGVRVVFPDADIRCVPIADGGEGTVDAVVAAGGGEYRRVKVVGPLGRPVEAKYGTLPGGRAIIEMAAASGLPLVPYDERNPELTTTFGTGELILDALDYGCREFLIGIGGSATNDAGVGMAEALGYRFTDSEDRPVIRGGGSLSEIEHIDDTRVDARLADCTFAVACDVQNPLYGSEGAAHIYGPQKGADDAMVERLDNGLRWIAKKISSELGKSVEDIPGAGAAGGLGAGLVAFCGGTLKSGIDAVLDIVRFDDILADVDLILTGEGAMDGSTSYGKVPVGVARRASDRNIPVIAVVGNIGAGAENVYRHGIDGIMSTANGAMPLEEALSRSTELIVDAAERLMRFLEVGMRMGARLSTSTDRRVDV